VISGMTAAANAQFYGALIPMVNNVYVTFPSQLYIDNNGPIKSATEFVCGPDARFGYRPFNGAHNQSGPVPPESEYLGIVGYLDGLDVALPFPHVMTFNLYDGSPPALPPSFGAARTLSQDTLRRLFTPLDQGGPLGLDKRVFFEHYFQPAGGAKIDDPGFRWNLDGSSDQCGVFSP
jgi:hypothetical protein